MSYSLNSLLLSIKLYNVLTRRKEIFKPLRKEWVGLYTCGPTVYNFAHIGNLRTYVFEDVLRRMLEYAGYNVRHVMNITDVDDKIIRDAKKAGKSIFEFVKPCERAFFDDIEKLNIKPAWKYPKATEHIPAMIKIIQKLLQKGLAYQADGSVYFDISKFKKYGQLSGMRDSMHSHSERSPAESPAGSSTRRSEESPSLFSRIDADEYTKDDVQDFVLWKGERPGEPSWKTPFGKGRPGWHIECSAMSIKYLGSTFDIHAGGVDLIFPHHENEIAQSEGATGKPFVKFFVEGEHLLVEGEKMSKSLGNTLTLRDIESRGFNPLVFRYLMLNAHYRSKLNFTQKSLEAAQKSLERLYDFVWNLKGNPSTSSGTNYINVTVRAWLRTYLKKFEQAISNDLDTPKVLAVMWDLIHDYNKNTSRYNPKEVLKLLYNFDEVIGLGLKEIRPELTPPKILELALEREELRKEKQWAEADRIRQIIKRIGYTVEDTSKGPKLRREK